jgi:hypothetical protein
MSSGFLKIHQDSAFWIEMWNQNINLLPYLYYCILYTYTMINKCSTQFSNEVKVVAENLYASQYPIPERELILCINY